VAAGSVAALVQQCAAELDLDLGDVRCGDERNRLRWAGVVGTVPDRKEFRVVLGASGWELFVSTDAPPIECVSGRTGDLHEVVRAAAAWRRGAMPREVKAVAPFVRLPELAEAHSRGPADAVAVMWRLLRDRVARPRVESVLNLSLRSLVEAAHAEPKLSLLYPFTSHWTLKFSTCTRYPYSRNVPFIEPLSDGRLRVHAPTGRHIIKVADTAEQAVGLVVANLPAGCGPAVAGTVSDL